MFFIQCIAGIKLDPVGKNLAVAVKLKKMPREKNYYGPCMQQYFVYVIQIEPENITKIKEFKSRSWVNIYFSPNGNFLYFSNEYPKNSIYDLGKKKLHIITSNLSRNYDNIFNDRFSNFIDQLENIDIQKMIQDINQEQTLSDIFQTFLFLEQDDNKPQAQNISEADRNNWIAKQSRKNVLQHKKAFLQYYIGGALFGVIMLYYFWNYYKNC